MYYIFIHLQSNLGCYDQGETFANDNIGTIRIRSNSHVSQGISAGPTSNLAGSNNNEQILQCDAAAKERSSVVDSSQEPMKRYNMELLYMLDNSVFQIWVSQSVDDNHCYIFSEILLGHQQTVNDQLGMC